MMRRFFREGLSRLAVIEIAAAIVILAVAVVPLFGGRNGEPQALSPSPSPEEPFEEAPRGTPSLGEARESSPSPSSSPTEPPRSPSPTPVPSPSPTATPSPSPSESPPPSPQAANVTIQNFRFSPATLTVAAGSTVLFTNKDAAAHSATADDQSFNTGLLSQDQSASVVFTTPGTFTYHCAPHPWMTATIIVQ